jgi:hypothetical protein
MKYNKIFTGVLVIGLLASSCNKYDFGDLNQNPAPDRVTKPSTRYLLANAIWGQMGNITAIEPLLYSQQLAETQYPGTSLYNVTQSNWSGYFAGALQDLQKIIDLNSGPLKGDSSIANNGSNANQIAAARIFKAWLFSIVTDRWGDAPYSKALGGNIAPTYDRQADIYRGIIGELTDAVNKFDAGAAPTGDILFNGDITKWKKFANSLRIVLSMRTVKADRTFAEAQFKAAVADAAGHITSNADNATFRYQAPAFANPLQLEFATRLDYGVSEFFLNQLISRNDPRTPFMVKKNGANFKGVPYGRDRGFMNGWYSANPDYSTPNGFVVNAGAALPLISAAQIAFLKAEAASYGWIPANACADYYNGVRLSCEMWGVTNAADITTYSNSAAVSIGTTYEATDFTNIVTQRYINSFMSGWETWFDWRRTNVPALTPALNAVNVSKRIPRRHAYPGTEIGLNKVNYNAAVANIGGDDSHDVRVWWDRP